MFFYSTILLKVAGYLFPLPASQKKNKRKQSIHTKNFRKITVSDLYVGSIKSLGLNAESESSSLEYYITEEHRNFGTIR